LVMDFDPVHEKNARGGLHDPSMEKQLERLLEAIEETKESCHGVKFCPFIGLDFRKFQATNGLAGFQALWDKYGKTSDQIRGSNLQTGDVIGVKLYPPIGFNPNPVKSHDLAMALSFYKWCIEKGIPITTHCQDASGSFSVNQSTSKINRNTSGKNWWNLFENNASIHDLRINFAHFGGEEGLKEFFDEDQFPDPIATIGSSSFGSEQEFNKNTWTHYLIKLLKKYPNTYTDISAFEFADETARSHLVKVLKMDREGKFNISGQSNHKLVDKLLWGSDVPMIISSKSYRLGGGNTMDSSYRHLFNRFLQTMALAYDPSDDAVNSLCYKNPGKFLSL
jgi:hypothetical protein